jgi:hypothetical protein
MINSVIDTTASMREIAGIAGTGHSSLYCPYVSLARTATHSLNTPPQVNGFKPL